MAAEWLYAGLVIFATIFLLEFVDRTNLVVVSLAAKHPPREVWAGATLGFALATAIAVAVGTLFLAELDPYLFYVRVGGGIGVAAYGVYSLFRAGKEADIRDVGTRGVVLQAFLMIAFLEMGDSTQLITLLFVTTVGNPLVVFVAAVLALSSTAAVGSRTGQYLRARLGTRVVEQVSASLILVVGLALIVLAFYGL